MTKNKNLAAVLRNCADMSTPCGNCPYKGTDGICIKMLLNDAADAIEAPNRLLDLNTERCEGLRKQLREAQEQYEKHLNELEQQLPKRGEWILKERAHYFKCSICKEPIPYKFGYGGNRYYNFCPRCGADMRKMEVQDG